VESRFSRNCEFWLNIDRLQFLQKSQFTFREIFFDNCFCKWLKNRVQLFSSACHIDITAWKFDMQSHVDRGPRDTMIQAFHCWTCNFNHAVDVKLAASMYIFTWSQIYKMSRKNFPLIWVVEQVCDVSLSHANNSTRDYRVQNMLENFSIGAELLQLKGFSELPLQNPGSFQEATARSAALV